MCIRMHSNVPPSCIRMFECHSWVSEIGTSNALLVSNVCIRMHSSAMNAEHSWHSNALLGMRHSNVFGVLVFQNVI